MEKKAPNWYALSDIAIMEMIGKYIQETRLQQRKTQTEVAKAAGINRSTLSQIEKGGGTIITFIQIIRVLHKLDIMEIFELQSIESPLQLAKLEKNKRQRARSKKTIGKQTKSTW